jgi:hypothetical protein
MGTAAQYQQEYEASLPELYDFGLTGNESDLNKRIQEGIDYNRPLRAEQAKELEARNQIINRYNSTGDPLLSGLDMGQRERLKAYDIAGNNARMGELGSYMSAREGSVANTIKAWKDAWDTKYNAMKEKSESKKSLWQMAFDQEKEAQRAREAAAQLAATRASAAAANKKPSLSDAVNEKGSIFSGFGENGAQGQWFVTKDKNGNAFYQTRENAAREIAAATGTDYGTALAEVYRAFPG